MKSKENENKPLDLQNSSCSKQTKKTTVSNMKMEGIGKQSHRITGQNQESRGQSQEPQKSLPGSRTKPQSNNW